MSAQGKSVHVLWSELENVSIIRQATPTGHEDLLLMIWPKESLDLPKRGTYLPKWDTNYAGVKFCELGYFNASSAEIIDAASHHAGALWSDPRHAIAPLPNPKRQTERMDWKWDTGQIK